jgi:nucleoid-associated protein YgaU
MGIFDSMKNAFGNKAEQEADVTIGPSQMLRNAGLDPSNLKFAFSAGTITISGEIAEEADRRKILDVLGGTPGISTVEDHMNVAAPQPVEAPEVESAIAETRDVAEAKDVGEEELNTYTVESGDTLWKISQEVYGDGSKYMKIFEANTGLLKDPDQIFPGQKLLIPKLGE